MKYALLLLLSAGTVLSVSAQNDGNKKPPVSPPASAKETIQSGATVTINYGQPSVKGRKIGTELEPKPGQVWRTGANAATTFEVSQDVTINGQALPKGKYGMFTLVDGDKWTIIFNKIWDQWGAYEYKEGEDALRVDVTGSRGSFSEKLLISIDKTGQVNIAWGDQQAAFTVS